MNVDLVVNGLSTFVIVWGAIAGVHHITCDCRSCPRGRINIWARTPRFLPRAA
ncbi:hypothetical protein SK571_13445 [Lentzea sp. BCCO 10_0798]|uniref:Uncharacterized protein n=1 Tax=Lentzea kristufekii TaxID=3095430 RepID=A0ABU4TQ37_9PSEU|nr:hypothetical protein [Lentzea sp. BCCO 10_0798]MDX8050390.1 hypothetical protein [Lentzea sp. BCCO 10_0798]